MGHKWATDLLMEKTMNILHELEWRGLIADRTDPESFDKHALQGPLTLYAGFDPTADSLHVGNLVPLLGLRRYQLAGHKPIALAGGATGAIGDPSGKSAERQLLTRDLLNHNIAQVKKQLQKFLDFNPSSQGALLMDNADWIAEMSYLDFLRDVGKFFTVNKMVAKESVRARMEDRDSGISYTEFSYMLLQAYDFYHLCRNHNCTLQIGGSDQWGNITAGIELCHKKLQRQVHGQTLPLITNSDGSKFGKSEGGAVWLDPAKTSVYRFYQFWIRTDDRDVIRYLKFFTFLGEDAIGQLETSHEQDPGRREAQKALANEMTRLIHGETAAEEVLKASQVLFGGGLEDITESTFTEIALEIPSTELPAQQFGGEGVALVDLWVSTGLATSKGQARKDIQGGGANVNNARETDIQRQIKGSELLFGKYILLRKGKKHYALVKAMG